jgi:23S rRNA pseudouridine1911/1915/1917 synthase
MLPQVIARADSRRRGKGVPPPVRAVHRLDRETSGLMVFARTVRAERALGEQFRHHTTFRRYMAIAQGSVEAQTIASRLVRDRGDGRRGSTHLPNVGKPATTHVRPLDQLAGYTMIECQLETGRTHQIRIHLSEQGNPVCGDKLYHQPLFQKPIPDTSDAPRLALHAAEIGFTHPLTGEQMHFQSPLPADLKDFWKRLKETS